MPPSSPALLEAEAGVLDATVLGGRLLDLRTEVIGGVPYLTFGSAADLDPIDVARLSTLSSGYALFARVDGALRPVDLVPLQHLDDDLLTIQKYAGKTNELFTRMLLNVTIWASAAGADLVAGAERPRPIRILDPMCGRGTTLHQALVYGVDADGLDVDGKDFEAHEAFIKTWLRRKRLKHTADVTPIRRDGRHLGRRLDVELAADKELWKSGTHQHLRMVNADTTQTAEFFKPHTFDALVTDMPYGVQHGAHAAGGLDRSPLDLLEAALPGWVRVMRPRAALGISWNTHVAARADAVALLCSGRPGATRRGPVARLRAPGRPSHPARRPGGRQTLNESQRRPGSRSEQDAATGQTDRSTEAAAEPLLELWVVGKIPQHL